MTIDREEASKQEIHISNMGDFAELDRLVDETVADPNGLPGVVLVAINRTGQTLYSKCAGKRSLSPDASEMTMDTVFWLASFTKFMTAIAIMQCVEKGLLHLDAPVGNILPEYLEPKILRGYTAEDKPILEKAQHALTLRHLMTHSSGLSYDLFNEKLIEWSKKTGRIDNQQSGTLEGFKYPLLFEPGFGYVYSAGLDWGGQMVERVTRSTSLEAYCQKNIWEPLGLNGTTFKISKNTELSSRLAGIALRKPDGSLVPGTHQPRDVGADICSGGSGLYGTGPDYVRVLAEIINDGGILLKPETVKEMFRPQLPDPKYLQEAFDSSFSSPLRMAPNWDNPTAAVQYGLSFMLNVHETPAGRAAGSAQWSGAANTYWWADYKKGIAGVVMAQTLPYGDQRVIELYKAFETAVYKNADNF